MVTQDDIKRWDEYNIRYNELLTEGASKGFVLPYFDEFFDKLRDYYSGDISVPILLLYRDFVNGYCYDCAPLVTLAFKDNDYSILYGDVNSLKLNPKYVDCAPGYADHCFARVEDDGMEWIIDTTVGLIFEKGLYEKLEEPKIRLEKTKEDNEVYLRRVVSKKLNRGNLGVCRLALDVVEKNPVAIQPIYNDKLKEEIKLLRKKYNEKDVKM